MSRIVICESCRTPIEYEGLTCDMAKIIVLFSGINNRSEHVIVTGGKCVECEE